MIIIGVDPGTIITGFGIVKYENSKLSYLYSGIIKTPTTKEIPPRLESIYNELTRLIKLYNPSQFAIETVFYNNNVQSILKIGYVRGISLLAAQQHKLEINEYSPREIKKSVVGNGAASKEQVQFMIKKLLSLNIDFPKFDESDAIAIAICHAFKKDSLSHKSGSWKKFIDANPDKVL
ncbi:MAG: crossover junction endodeoxyribonuclease RuvC [Bacteroidetes bacterium]|nr:crossover junction endodeoxyribonuclease RuvC [Bacteroidota bacterium]MBU1116579.1 crossover junction endodeoxyribonuclease RuvC [Bacteroidota bacterium]MBU1797199.1 crossover junction endodeoxyribonuclease RuvC [Bacteroidota bacterium]